MFFFLLNIKRKIPVKFKKKLFPLNLPSEKKTNKLKENLLVSILYCANRMIYLI